MLIYLLNLLLFYLCFFHHSHLLVILYDGSAAGDPDGSKHIQDYAFNQNGFERISFFKGFSRY